MFPVPNVVLIFSAVLFLPAVTYRRLDLRCCGARPVHNDCLPGASLSDAHPVQSVAAFDDCFRLAFDQFTKKAMDSRLISEIVYSYALRLVWL